MKKFLTVLLALSVVFTYSFSAVGTAFAAETDPYEIAKDLVDAKATTVKAEAAKAGVYDTAAVNTAVEEATKAGYTKVQALYETYIEGKDPINDTAFYNDLNAWLTAAPTDEGFTKVYQSEVVEADCAIKVAAAKGLVNNVKVADYVDADQPLVAQYKAQTLNALDAIEAKESGITIKAIWRTDVTEWQNQPLTYRDAINIYLYGATAGWATIYDADDKLSVVVANTAGTTDVKGLFVMLNGLTTVAEDEENTVITDAYIENIMANITYNAKAASDGYYLTKKVSKGDSVTVDADGKIYGVKVAKASSITADEATAINNALLSKINDTLEVLAVRVQWIADEYGKKELDKQVGYYKDPGNFSGAIAKAEVAKDFYADVVAYANKLKDAVNYVGDKMYNDADIDAALEDANYIIYGKCYEGYSTSVESYFTEVTPIYDEVAVAMQAAIDKWQTHIIYSGAKKTAEADKKYCADYYAPNPTVAASSVNWQKEYADIKKEAIEALREVKTIAEIEAIMADADVKLADLRTAENDNAKLNTQITKYKTALAEFADEQWELVKPGAEYLADSYVDAETAGVELLEGVATIDQLASAYTEAKALFGDIKTKAVLKAEATDVQNKIIALPTTAVRLENEDSYMATYDAYQDYLDNYGADKTDIRDSYALEKAMGNLKKLQQNAVKEAIKEMNADKVVTRAEYEAVKAMFDKYTNYYAQYDEAFDDTAKTMENAIATAKATVMADEVAAVEKMIAKLTTASSIKDILAAKEAYDALSGSQQRKIAKAFPYKVQLLNDRIIDSVESLKIVACSSAKKGSITVKWRIADGDATAADGYQVYKSKKAQTGYTFMGKTKKTSMVNKKNLKKGTRYFYKVRAYVDVDGTRYYSDWSNKANRIAK